MAAAPRFAFDSIAPSIEWTPRPGACVALSPVNDAGRALLPTGPIEVPATDRAVAELLEKVEAADGNILDDFFNGSMSVAEFRDILAEF